MKLPPPPATVRRVTVEIAGAYAVVTALAAALYRVDAVRSVYSAIVAGLLLYVPAWVLRRHELEDYGATWKPLVTNLLLVAGAVALLFPLFAAGYLAWQRFACALPPLRALAVGPCTSASLWLHARLRAPPGAFELVASQIIVVALPEEFFFRGFVQGRLAEVWRSQVGPIVVASALFALCHVIVQGNLATLAVFFPSLVFGWMRARTRSILPGTLFHALCNLYIDSLHRSFFG